MLSRSRRRGDGSSVTDTQILKLLEQSNVQINSDTSSLLIMKSGGSSVDSNNPVMVTSLISCPVFCSYFNAT